LEALCRTKVKRMALELRSVTTSDSCPTGTLGKSCRGQDLVESINKRQELVFSNSERRVEP
jgi:hypothetical protein